MIVSDVSDTSKRWRPVIRSNVFIVQLIYVLLGTQLCS